MTAISTRPAVSRPAPQDSAAGAAAFRDAVWTAEGLARRLPVDTALVRAVAARNRLRVPRAWLDAIEQPGDPLWRQAVPAAEELAEEDLPEDPLAEDAPGNSPVPHLTHRYPDRALLLVTDLCPLFCRFCMRKRKTLRGAAVTSRTVARGIAHVRVTPAIREVILSGGDPLMLPDARLAAILGELRAIPHIEVLRLHTRMPGAEPRRVTPALAATLARFRPLFVGVHFNHPREVTLAAEAALALLAGAGLPLHSQTVLLKGVNDDPAVLADLYRRLIRAGVHPYYLHHADQVPGTAHFRLAVHDGL